MDTFLYTLAVIFIFGVIIVFHEAGHFFVAKLGRIRVHEFALGLGPRLFGVKRGETDYSVHAIPVGGMVRVAGMEPEDYDDPQGFNAKPRSLRIAVIAAGPVMNVILAALIFFLSYTVLGMVKDVTPQIARVLPGKAAAVAGLKAGDTLVEVNGVSSKDLADLQEQIRKNPEKPVAVVVERAGKRLSFQVIPEKTQVPFLEKDAKGEKVVNREIGQIGIVFQVERERLPVGKALTKGLQDTWDIFSNIFKGLSLVVQRRAPADLRGPVGIVSMLYEEARVSWTNFLLFSGMLNVMIAFFNLVPFPALDGSRILFIIIEAIRRKAIDPQKEAIVHTVGLVVLLLFVLVVTVGDIWRQWGPQ